MLRRFYGWNEAVLPVIVVFDACTGCSFILLLCLFVISENMFNFATE